MHYDANPDIIQSFVDIQELYNPLQDSQTDYPTVKAWLKQIRTEGFTDDMMQEILAYIYKLSKKDKPEEAALLLLVSSATQNSAANYVLARELFKGVLFQANKPAAFGIFLALAREGHLEALCDVALFYKNGITVEENKKHAAKLYKIAMDAGIQRAEKHYNELKKNNFI